MFLCLIGTQSVAMKRAGDNIVDEQFAKRQRMTDLEVPEHEKLEFEIAFYSDFKARLSQAIAEGDFFKLTVYLRRLNPTTDFDSNAVMSDISMSDKFTQEQKIALFKLLSKADFTTIDPESGSTPLHTAVEKNEPEVVQYFLYEKHIDPNLFDLNDCTPWLSVSSVKMADILWRAGADPNAKDTYGRSLLHLVPGDEQLVRYALIHGTEFGKDSRGLTPSIPGIKNAESAREVIITELSTKLRKPITDYTFDRSIGQKKRLLSHTPYEESETASMSLDSESQED